ncbi:MAG: UDP-4-amino-4,6-dideoxy-N-acetyl-beta-L-altrosamine transaminase [Bacteroidota bacterium]
MKIPYGRQNISQEDIDAVAHVLKEDFLTQGPRIDAFEAAFAEYIGCKYAVAVANGTAALHLAALALDVDENTRVIGTPITFSASSNCIRYCGGHVTFADIDPETVLLDIDKVREILEQHPKGTFSGIVPVDFAGHPVNLEQYRTLADEYGLWILEDACHAPGGYFTDSSGVKQHSGNGKYAELAIFSFHPVKHIACGEGGMITTNDKALYDKLKILRTHGITRDPALISESPGGWYYEMQMLGYNYRLTDIQCALGMSQLKKAGAGLARRREIAAIYDAAFANTKVETISPPKDGGHAYHLYVIKTENRKGLYDHLRSNGIFGQVHYIPVHTLPYYRELYPEQGQFPHAEAYYDQCLSIPMYPTLSDDEQQYVIRKVLEFVEK